MAEKPPFLEDGSQYGISRTDFRRLRKADKRELMIQWFHESFEDPANRTPREEGEYVWIWGGPYDARDRLQAKFDGVASESLIEEVAQEVERGGITDWTSVHTTADWEDIDWSDDAENPPSLDSFSDELTIAYGSAADHQKRAEVRSALINLQRALDWQRPIGIGHNQAPTDEVLLEVQALPPVVMALRLEFGKAKPAIATVKRWAKSLRDALIAVGKWAAQKADKAVDAAMKTIGIGLGGWLLNLAPPLHDAFQAIIEWLKIVAQAHF